MAAKDTASSPTPAQMSPAVDNPTESASGPEFFDQAIEFLRPLLRDPSQAHVAAARVVAVAEMYSGPIPHPRDLKAYEDAVPGSGREIILMAKREQEHHHKTQSREMLYPYLGLICGFVSFLACIAGATYLAMNGRNAVAALMLGVPALGAVGWFINSRLSAPVEMPNTPAPQKNTPGPKRR